MEIWERKTCLPSMFQNTQPVEKNLSLESLLKQISQVHGSVNGIQVYNIQWEYIPGIYTPRNQF